MIFFFKKHFSIILIIFLIFIFFYKSLFFGQIPFPGDMLVGAYFPWMDHRWGGFVTDVPIKNPLISDVFSQFFVWKKIIINSFKSLRFPLWNIYSYSGYPLFANFHSGVLNPFNLLMLFFGDANGWTLLVISQFLFSCFTMNLFLKKIYPNSFFATLAGTITYAFSGFMITWSQFVTAGFAMIWLPLIFLCIENFFKTKKIKHILYLSILYFLMMTSGHLQALVYGLIISGIYFIYKYFNQKSFKKLITIFWYTITVLLGILLMSIQLLPTMEMGKYSVRFDENYISEYNYGLLSLDRIVTLFAPDYFGNPTTFNFWGNFNYHETIIYTGVLTVFAILFCIFNFKKLKIEKFFFYTTFISLLFIYDTFFGKLIYKLKLPLISTSAAGRLAFIYTFSISILVTYFFKNLAIHSLKKYIKYYWIYIFYFVFIIISTYLNYKNSATLIRFQNNYYIAMRNLVIPLLISIIISIIVVFVKNFKAKNIILILIIIVDLFRFGWKYLPFTSKEYLYPETNITKFLKTDKSIFRIEKEKGPLMTPNVWSFYELQSTSGYDPMALKEYSIFFQNKINMQGKGSSSRYSEIDNYDSNSLGEGNVKYLLVLNYNKQDVISPDGDHFNHKVNTENWNEVFRYKSTSILENKNLKPRVEIINKSGQGSYSNLDYSSNRIKFITNTTDNESTLILRDTWYPGWKAYINNKEIPINKYLNIYRLINIPKGENNVEFIYKPKPFYIGFYISSFTFLVWLIIFKKYKNKSV